MQRNMSMGKIIFGKSPNCLTALQIYQPKLVNTNEDLSLFKSALRLFLEYVPNNPPTVGYTVVCSNSLIDCKCNLQ